jgi:hypothetical protein
MRVENPYSNCTRLSDAIMKDCEQARVVDDDPGLNAFLGLLHAQDLGFFCFELSLGEYALFLELAEFFQLSKLFVLS